MNRTIRTYDELLEEKARLNLLLNAQKDLVRQDINQIKLELAPVRSAISRVQKIATREKSVWILDTTANTLIDLFVKQMVLSRAGWFTKLVVPFVAKNFSSHIIADNKDKIVNKLSSWFGGKKHHNGKMPKEKKEKGKQLNDEEED